MKNNEIKINAETMKQLETIAKKASYAISERGGIDTRYNDEEDFTTVSVGAIREMLEEAYRLGMKNAENK